MKKILINFAHPARSKSKINSALRSAVEDLEGVTINDLYATYPDFLIDVKREQLLCEDNDIIIFQHPFYWYSSPAIVQEWFDLVLEHGWAYGSKASGMKDKILMQVISAGGNDSTYRRGGFNHFTLGELTSPVRAMAKLCKMNWIPPFTVLGVHRDLSKEQIKIHADNFRNAIIALRDDTIDMEKAKQNEYLNSDLNSIIRRGEK
ncbi:NAD(P)H-dependent oxidoreductase [uncultured Ilyobacter sp.]|uniref:NAD(P)H-dependent oxidoreductase n=1 Tax=uncultured Ilyobacter sp. TaxID=544433 RepID=UPI0029C03A83|nr:NAD(P)H-dependent oxidoreductase [uncultured Ilyobacter sp.]